MSALAIAAGLLGAVVTVMLLLRHRRKRQSEPQWLHRGGCSGPDTLD